MLNVSTEVISVNIFRRGADIVRRGQAEIHAGKQVLLFSGIPETADADTLRIFGAEGMTCSNFRVRNSGEDAEESPEIKELQTRIRELRELQEVKKLQADLWKTNGDFTGRVQASPAEVEEYIAKLPERIGTLQAEMIDFISSMEQNVQVLSLDNSRTARARVNENRSTYDYTPAIHDMKKATALMPDFPYSYYNLGNLYTLSSDLPEAILQYTKAIQLYPNLPEAYYNRGLVLIYLKDNEKGCLATSFP